MLLFFDYLMFWSQILFSGLFCQNRLYPSSGSDIRICQNGSPVSSLVPRHSGQKNAPPKKTLKTKQIRNLFDKEQFFKKIDIIYIRWLSQVRKHSKNLDGFTTTTTTKINPKQNKQKNPNYKSHCVKSWSDLWNRTI